MELLITILVGAAAGFLADVVFKSFSFSLIMQIVLGIAGAFVGKFIFAGEFSSMLGLPLIVGQILEAFIGAAVILGVIVLYRKFTK